jgi:hypothetical protein
MRMDHYRIYVAHNNYMTLHLDEKRKQSASISKKIRELSPRK